jgi:predicted transport protein
MEKADVTMLENIKKNYGKSLEEWINVVKKRKLEKHGEILKFLKEKHGFTHGYANLVSLKARGSDAGSAESTDQLIIDQYKGKENLKPIYDAIIKEIVKFGKDIEIAPKKAAVSLRRKRQFALVQPTTKTRIDLGLKLKGKGVLGKLGDSGPFGTMCTHRVKIETPSEVDKEVISWLKEAYNSAG